MTQNTSKYVNTSRRCTCTVCTMTDAERAEAQAKYEAAYDLAYKAHMERDAPTVVPHTDSSPSPWVMMVAGPSPHPATPFLVGPKKSSGPSPPRMRL